MSHFILIHGFNDRTAGAKNIDRLEPYLVERGHTVDKDGTDYGYLGLFWIRIRKHSAVLRILAAILAAQKAGLDVVLLMYSNGNNYGLKAVALLAVGQVRAILVHPALPKRNKFPRAIEQAWVAYTRSDWVVRLSSWVRWAIPAWGRMGATGYLGTDPRISNIDYTAIARGHGGLFRDGAIAFFADESDRLARSSTL